MRRRCGLEPDSNCSVGRLQCTDNWKVKIKFPKAPNSNFASSERERTAALGGWQNVIVLVQRTFLFFFYRLTWQFHALKSYRSFESVVSVIRHLGSSPQPSGRRWWTSVWSCLAVTHKNKLPTVLDKGLKLGDEACHAPRRESAVRLLDETIRHDVCTHVSCTSSWEPTQLRHCRDWQVFLWSRKRRRHDQRGTQSGPNNGRVSDYPRGINSDRSWENDFFRVGFDKTASQN